MVTAAALGQTPAHPADEPRWRGGWMAGLLDRRRAATGSFVGGDALVGDLRDNASGMLPCRHRSRRRRLEAAVSFVSGTHVAAGPHRSVVGACHRHLHVTSARADPAMAATSTVKARSVSRVSRRRHRVMASNTWRRSRRRRTELNARVPRDGWRTVPLGHCSRNQDPREGWSKDAARRPRHHDAYRGCGECAQPHDHDPRGH